MAALAVMGPAAAEDRWLGSLQLRGGCDSNPVLSPQGNGGALSGLAGVIVAGRSNEDYVAAFSGEASYRRYAAAGVSPLQRYKASFDIANRGQGGVALKAAAFAEAFDNYDTRSFKASQSLRAQWARGALCPFVTVEAGYAALNESNPALGDFLPKPQVFLRGTGTISISPMWRKISTRSRSAMAAIRSASIQPHPVLCYLHK